jgi:hypothetical protein
MKKTIFISWETHQRTRTICERFHIPLFEMIERKAGLLKYLRLIPCTLKTIRTEKPAVLIVQNPSIVLTTFAMLIRPFFSYQLIVDAHNEGVRPFIHNNKVINAITNYNLKNANCTIVTNNMLFVYVSELGGRAIIFPDLLPDTSNHQNKSPELTNGKYLVTFICTYAQDEPYYEVFMAAKKLEGRIILNVTGRIPTSLDESTLSSNIQLLGFIPEEVYWDTLASSHIVIDLTTMENCLVCGAYEALAISKPLILSDDIVNTELFPMAVLTKNTATAIESAISHTLDNLDAIRAQVVKGRIDFLEKQQAAESKLLEIIQSNDS